MTESIRIRIDPSTVAVIGPEKLEGGEGCDGQKVTPVTIIGDSTTSENLTPLDQIPPYLQETVNRLLNPPLPDDRGI